MAELPPLARTVAVGGVYYQAGDQPPLRHAKQITNPKNWTGNKVPDFDNVDEPDEPARGVGNSDAANAQRTGLPGFGAADPATTESAAATGADAKGDTDGDGDGGDPDGDGDKGGDGDGTGSEGTGSGDAAPLATGQTPTTGTGDDAGTTTPARTTARKTAAAKATTSGAGTTTATR
jgi:hypothetical protein